MRIWTSVKEKILSTSLWYVSSWLSFFILSICSVQRELNKLEDIGLGDLKCDKPGEFKVAAQTMDELAILIEEVGLDKIQQQFGIDFSFIISQ